MVSLRSHTPETKVEAAADRLAWLVVSFGLLALVAWRSFAYGESPWELLMLVVAGGAAGFGYRLWRGAVSRAVVLGIGLSLAVAAALGLVLALARPA